MAATNSVGARPHRAADNIVLLGAPQRTRRDPMPPERLAVADPVQNLADLSRIGRVAAIVGLYCKVAHDRPTRLLAIAGKKS
jgi:hypothetical protein